MINNDRIDSIYEAIKENSIDAFNDESLAKLLSMLTIDELELFIMNSFEKLGERAYVRLTKIKPFVCFEIKNYIHKIESSDMYKGFLNSVNTNTIREYIISLNATELGELKKILSIKNNEQDKDGINKIINLITSEIRKKDELKTKSLNV